MAFPLAELTRGQIIDEALENAGNKKLKTKARLWLNRLLDDLTLKHDWAFLKARTTLTLSGATFQLPADFRRAEDADALTVTVADGTGVYLPVVEHAPLDFQRLSQNGLLTVTASVPTIWTFETDLVNNLYLGRIWPVPAAAVTALLRYRYRIAPLDISDSAAQAIFDADIPKWPYVSMLIQYLYARALAYEDDARADIEMAKYDRELGEMKTEGLRAALSDTPTLPLDERVFRTPFRLE